MLPNEDLRQWLVAKYPPERAQAILDKLAQLQETAGVRADAATEEVALSLKIQEPPRPACDHPVSPGVHVVGRSPDCTVRLNDRTVSRIHCVLVVKQDQTAHICDFQSTFGTSVRGEPLQSWTWHEVAEGDDIVVGQVVHMTLSRPS